MSDDLLANNLVLLLKRVHLGTRRAFDEAFAQYDLTGPQAEILRQVTMQSGLEQRTLQERLGITSATLTGIIDGLVERELVERRLSADDARVKQLFLTDRGRALTAALATLTTRLEQRMIEGFSPAEQALLRDWLRRMAINVGGRDGEACH